MCILLLHNNWCTMLEIKCLICWNTVRITTLRIRLNQLSLPNHYMLNRIGECAQVRCLLTFISTSKNKKNLQPLWMCASFKPMHWRDGRLGSSKVLPFITCHFVIVLCHQPDCWKTLEWMCRLWLLVIKRQRVTTSTEKPLLVLLSVASCCRGKNDNIEDGTWRFSRLFVGAYQMIYTGCKT